MSITEIDPNTALIVVDLQAGTLRNPMPGIEDVVANSAKLAAAFRARGLPVVLANIDGTTSGRNDYGSASSEWPAELAELVGALDVAGTDILLTRRSWSVFSGTDLPTQLPGVTQLVIAGVATSFGVESTARDAFDRGYNVTLVTDAMTDPRAEAHENSVTRIFPVLGQTGTTSELLALL